jgi:hypothetical protein
MDLKSKQEQIESIDDEVNILHPLLHELLQTLANVSYVEYTHGPNEMGADFILERHDPALHDTYYIGVIAKTEKILQNFSDVERQINECNVKRFIRAGTQEVRLQEIWIITTKSISHNAKAKIAETYANRKLHFFDADWLVKIIDGHFPYYWHQLPTATGGYLASLSQRMTEIDAQTSLLQFAMASKTLIELDVEEIEDDTYKEKSRKRKSRRVNFHKEILGNKVTLLEADMGYGKSTLVRKLAADLANPEVLKQTKILPIFQTFSIFERTEYKTIEATLEALVGKPAYDEAIATNTTFLLILDGIDETNGNTATRRELIASILTHVRSNPNVRLLLTSRPFKLIDELPAFKNTVKRYRICHVSTKKLIAFIIKTCEQINLPKKLYDDLAKSDLFRQLPQNPIAATLISNLLSQNSQDLPSNLTELYSKSVELMLGRWDERKTALTTEKLFGACERLSRHLARFMIENKLVFISADEARQMIESFLRERNMGVTAEDVHKYLFSRSGIFGKLDESQTIFFKHRSFAEYLYALDAYERRDLEVDTKAFHPYWTNVVFFYVGLLAECPELLQRLLTLPVPDERSRWIRLLQLGNYLLAGYQSPYAVVEDAVRVILIELAKTHKNVKTGELKSGLRGLSEISLLCVFAGLTKHVLGYEFFRQALPLTMAQIDEDRTIDDETRIYALFFAACALGDIDDICGFTFLLGKHKTEALPLPISLGVKFETELPDHDYSDNRLVKHHVKKLRQILTPPKGEEQHMRESLNLLFDKPLSTTKTSHVEGPFIEVVSDHK